jgi:hypothetical protein
VLGERPDGGAEKARHDIVGVLADEHAPVEQLGAEFAQEGQALDLADQLEGVGRARHLAHDARRLGEAVAAALGFNGKLVVGQIDPPLD